MKWKCSTKKRLLASALLGMLVTTIFLGPVMGVCLGALIGLSAFASVNLFYFLFVKEIKDDYEKWKHEQEAK